MRWFGVAGIALATSSLDRQHVSVSLVLDSRGCCPPRLRRQRHDSKAGSVSSALRRSLSHDFRVPDGERFVPLIEEFGIKPILAVVPDNRDPELELSPPDPEFLGRDARNGGGGATIALHGYRHLCEQRGARAAAAAPRDGVRGRARGRRSASGFRRGLAILRGHGLNPRIWVAPRHGFDAQHCGRCAQREFTPFSDGFARVPFTRGGVTWIPQQLWAPVEKDEGPLDDLRAQQYCAGFRWLPSCATFLAQARCAIHFGGPSPGRVRAVGAGSQVERLFERFGRSGASGLPG